MATAIPLADKPAVNHVEKQNQGTLQRQNLVAKTLEHLPFYLNALWPELIEGLTVNQIDMLSKINNLLLKPGTSDGYYNRKDFIFGDLIFTDNQFEFDLNDGQTIRFAKTRSEPTDPIYFNLKKINDPLIPLDLDQIAEILVHEVGHKIEGKIQEDVDVAAARVREVLNAHMETPISIDAEHRLRILNVDFIQDPERISHLNARILKKILNKEILIWLESADGLKFFDKEVRSFFEGQQFARSLNPTHKLDEKLDYMRLLKVPYFEIQHQHQYSGGLEIHLGVQQKDFVPGFEGSRYQKNIAELNSEYEILLKYKPESQQLELIERRFYNRIFASIFKISKSGWLDREKFFIEGDFARTVDYKNVKILVNFLGGSFEVPGKLIALSEKSDTSEAGGNIEPRGTSETGVNGRSEGGASGASAISRDSALAEKSKSIPSKYRFEFKVPTKVKVPKLTVSKISLDEKHLVPIEVGLTIDLQSRFVAPIAQEAEAMVKLIRANDAERKSIGSGRRVFPGEQKIKFKIKGNQGIREVRVFYQKSLSVFDPSEFDANLYQDAASDSFSSRTYIGGPRPTQSEVVTHFINDSVNLHADEFRQKQMGEFRVIEIPWRDILEDSYTQTERISVPADFGFNRSYITKECCLMVGQDEGDRRINKLVLVTDDFEQIDVENLNLFYQLDPEANKSQKQISKEREDEFSRWWDERRGQFELDFPEKYEEPYPTQQDMDHLTQSIRCDELF